MKVLLALCLSLLSIPAIAQAIDTGSVILYTIVAVSTPDRTNVATVTMTAQAYLNEATCRNAQEWFKREVPNNPEFGITTNSWCTIKVPY